MNQLKYYFQLARLNKPVGILLLLWPTLWGLWLANDGMPKIRLFLIFILGVVLTRSAGCVINDLWDQNFDKQVTRTKQRPLACGSLSVKQALIFLIGLSVLCLLLLCQLNKQAIFLGCIAAIIATIYPLMKRITHLPQIVLGIAFAMGIPMAFAASINQLPPLCWLLFILNVAWSISYDTAYAITDANDDIKIGVKSTALLFKHHSPCFIGCLQIIVLAGFILLGVLEHFTIGFYSAVAISALLFIYQQYLLNQQRPFAVFLNNQWVGFILWLGIVFGFL